MTTVGGTDLLQPEEVAFLLCIEANKLEPQGRLLCESLRKFGGDHSGSLVVAVSPRPALALGTEGRARLADLGVEYAVADLNRTGSPYGTINRIVAGAWAERLVARPYLVVLDTDMLFVRPPELQRADVGVRPVDAKGSASSGPGDPLDDYWRRICEIGGIVPDRLPYLKTTIDRVRIRASYNGGFSVVRRDLGVLAATQDAFFASYAESLRPLAGRGINVEASTGEVGIEASEWWGASQAALSVAIWSKTSDVVIYDPRYNVPLHYIAEGYNWPLGALRSEGHPEEVGGPILLHYHYLADPRHRTNFMPTLERFGVGAEIRHWLNARLSWFE